jgi:AcrR family transcriptional regulator
VSTEILARFSKPIRGAPMTETPSRPRRRTQAERTADTRSRLIQAAITCLFRTGYSATTIGTVAEEAAVSRGAITHQFPAKTDLMLAVVQSVFEDDGALYNATIATMDPRQWLLQLPRTMWTVISRPSGIAVIEIMLASRADPELAEKLRAIQTAIDKRAHAWSAERVKAASLAPHPDAEALHELYVAAIRGLALQATFMNNADGVQKSLRVLSDAMRHYYPEIDKQDRGA